MEKHKAINIELQYCPIIISMNFPYIGKPSVEHTYTRVLTYLSKYVQHQVYYVLRSLRVGIRVPW